MFTSGTTGPPKCLVQSAGGILLTHLKESVIHTDLKRDDVILYLTSCGWMSWNWLVSSLAVGAGVVFYDGSPFYPHPGALLEMAQDEKITMFGTSARYFETLMNKGVKPGSEYDLSPIKTVLSAGSALSSKGYEFIYKEMKDDIWLVEMSGGTDINGNFVLGNPMGPVYAREIQCRGLGMKVEAFNDDGKPCTNEKGELVCLAAAPSMPIYFWDDPDNKKYLAAYFDRWPGVWRHGDYILINERGGIVIYGRSDTTLTAGGGRIGTAEIYPVVEHMEEIQDSLVIEQSWKDDVRVILFVQLSPGIELTEDLKEQIADRLKKDVTPAIIPAKIIAVPEIPYTLNMKKVELAVRKMVEGQPVLNKDSLRNPESLDYFADLKELH
jgi:acetoacetyl-CoA synthetase